MMQLTYFKHYRLVLLLLLILAVIKFSACTENEGASEAFDPTVFLNHSENYTLTYQDCDISSDSCTYISISYPVFDLKENEETLRIRKRIEKILLGNNNKTIEDVCKGFISDYSQCIKEESVIGEAYDLQGDVERVGELGSTHLSVCGMCVWVWCW